jgi:hypothetical protein
MRDLGAGVTMRQVADLERKFGFLFADLKRAAKQNGSKK